MPEPAIRRGAPAGASRDSGGLRAIQTKLIGQIDDHVSLLEEVLAIESDLLEDQKFILRLIRDQLLNARFLVSVDWTNLDAAARASFERELRRVKKTVEEEVPTWYERNQGNVGVGASVISLGLAIGSSISLLLA